MHFFYLSELGRHYDGEEGFEGVRRGTFDAMAKGIRDAIMNVRALEAQLKPPGEGANLATKKRFFELFQNPVEKAKVEAEIREQKARVERGRKKLTMQGAVIDANGFIDWGVSTRTVVYDHEAAARGLTKLHYVGGLLCMDAAGAHKLDTSNMVTHHSGPGFAIYVMSNTGSIHVSSHSVGHRHHSSLLAGEKTAGAGEIKVEKGKLTCISNKSGHYCPTVVHLMQTLYLLQKRRVNLASTRVCHMTSSGTTQYNSVQEFLTATQASGEDDMEYAKLLGYLVLIPWPEFEGLITPKGWRWVDLAERIAGERGLKTVDGNLPVPHRDVRKWLKSIKKEAYVKVQSGFGR
jgi:hypothetical protein